MDRDNTIARLENIAKHAVHTAGEDTFILSLDDGLAIHEAIEALKAQLSQEGTTSDLISRQAAIDAAKDWYEGLICGSVNGLIKRLKALPPVQPEVLACGSGELVAQPEQPIIKCKDCKWWKKQKDSAQGRCRLLGIYPTGGWYCANGAEERTGG